jgi:hypothetical protein
MHELIKDLVDEVFQRQIVMAGLPLAAGAQKTSAVSAPQFEQVNNTAPPVAPTGMRQALS